MHEKMTNLNFGSHSGNMTSQSQQRMHDMFPRGKATEAHPIHEILQKRTKHKIRTNRLQNWSSDTREGEAEDEWCAYLSEHAEGCVLNTKQSVLILGPLPQPVNLIQVLTGLYYI